MRDLWNLWGLRNNRGWKVGIAHKLIRNQNVSMSCMQFGALFPSPGLIIIGRVCRGCALFEDSSLAMMASIEPYTCLRGWPFVNIVHIGWD